MTATICISCGEPMAPNSERPPSMRNVKQCVPCIYNLELPASRSTLSKADGSACNLPSAIDRNPLGVRDAGQKETRGEAYPSRGGCGGPTFPPGPTSGPLGAPERCEPAYSVPGGNPFPNGRW